MIKHLLTFTMLSALFLNACKEAPKQENVDTEITETVEANTDDFVTTTTINKDGKQLEIVFNNTKGTATFVFDGETVDLQQEKAASGFWYKNDTYELRGKGNDIQLKKGDEIVFEHEDEIINTTYKNDNGDTLNVTVNASTNEAKVYLNGGEQIDLIGEKPASGIWFKNDQYELRGKGEKLELTKDGETVFKN
ncbi:MliC family protein [Bizionia paragorgiae]|jgi:membrane-bound inhibitor of C-type lysozyme|uniref:MliC family protein n=1 Tax=Bizionia paragorgiae TaxID=283786 RepID=UPI00299DBA77|nr:MliC family protein [Bizionia paragorgiae]MDX1271459.1 MliC family protein [Bizionia paragorgiae]